MDKVFETERTHRPTLSYQRLHTVQPLSDAELHDKIRRTVPNKHELQVLESFLIFNKCAFSYSRPVRSLNMVENFRHVLKTNFYQPTKVALSFRLAPDFLPEVEYPKKPYGMFFVIGRIFFFWLGRRLRLTLLRMQATSSEGSTYVSVMSLVGVSGLFCPGTKKITRLTRGCCSMRITALHPHNRSRTRISLREARREPSCHRSYLFSLHPISVAHLYKLAWEQPRSDALRNTSM